MIRQWTVLSILSCVLCTVVVEAARAQGYEAFYRKCYEDAASEQVIISCTTVISRGHFAATAEAASTKTADLIPAFDAAGQQLVTEMTAWGLKGVGANAARCR